MTIRCHYYLPVFVALLSWPVLALTRDNNILVLSVHASCPAVSNALRKAEIAAANNQFSSAATQLNTALAVSDPAANTDLSTILPGDGPLSLCIHAARLWYMGLASQNTDEQVVNECAALIDTYSKQARDKGWVCYKMLFHRIHDYYVRRNNTGGICSNLERLLAYDPLDRGQLGVYLSILIKSKSKPAKVRDVLDNYCKAGGISDAHLELLKCQILQLEGGDALTAMLKWLKECPDVDFQTMKDAIAFARKQLDATEPQTVISFYNALTSLALAQPGDEQHVEVVAYLLTERQKIQAIVPELFGTNTTAYITGTEQ